MIEPLINGQKTKEITIKLVVLEMTEWWSNGWGWGYPLFNMIENEKDKVMLKVWNRFIYLINKNGYCDFLEEFSGIDDCDKKKYIEKFLTGIQLSWLKRKTDNFEIGGSSPSIPTDQ